MKTTLNIINCNQSGTFLVTMLWAYPNNKYIVQAQGLRGVLEIADAHGIESIK